MTAVPEWVTVNDVVALNQRIVECTYEPFLVSSPSGLDSAVNRPRQHYTFGPEETADDLVLLGVKLCVGISESQAFQQGNKRTGFAAMEMFFNLNGHQISNHAHGHIADMVLASAHPDRGVRLTEDEFAEQLDQYVVEIESDFLQGGMLSLGSLERIDIAMGQLGKQPTGTIVNLSAGLSIVAPFIIDIKDLDRD